MADSLQALHDKDAIRELVALYSRGVDRQDFALLRSLYTADAIEDDHGGAYSGSAEGYVDWLMRVMGRVETVRPAHRGGRLAHGGSDAMGAGPARHQRRTVRQAGAGGSVLPRAGAPLLR